MMDLSAFSTRHPFQEVCYMKLVTAGLSTASFFHPGLYFHLITLFWTAWMSSWRMTNYMPVLVQL